MKQVVETTEIKRKIEKLINSANEWMDSLMR